MDEIKNYGLIIAEQQPEEYILGGGEVPREVLQPDGQWDGYLPPDEIQRIPAFDTFNCTAFGTTNALEILMGRKYFQGFNWSDRALGIMAGTRPPGNDPQKVIETARTRGLIKDELLPFEPTLQTVDQYYSPSPLPEWHEDEAGIWPRTYRLLQEWLWNRGTVSVQEKQLRMMESLKCSPLNASMHAWLQGPDGIFFKPQGTQDNHWITIYGYVQGQYWKCFDSYDNSHKKIAWATDFEVAKRYHIEKLGPSAPAADRPKWLALLNWAANALKALRGLPTVFVAHNELAEVAPDLVVPDLPPPAPEPLPTMARRVCHEEGLDAGTTAELLATIHAESAWHLDAVNPRLDMPPYKNGSRDYGLCQFNTSDHGAGWYAKLISPADATGNPEKAVRLMVRQFKKGRANDWVAHKTGAHKKFLPLYT